VSSMAQISNFFGQMLSTVVHLDLSYEVHSPLSLDSDEVDRAKWRELLRPFNNVKSLHVYYGLVGELSRCLRLDDGELPLDLLPELQELTYYSEIDRDAAFTSFVDARRTSDRPVILVRHCLSPDSSSATSSYETLSSVSSEAENGLDI